MTTVKCEIGKCQGLRLIITEPTDYILFGEETVLSSGLYNAQVNCLA
jgi:hypothetical protein